ncbi:MULTISPECIES: hypothetical protein [unclassified Nocardia]|nr:MULTISPECIES: hypothetical protein [unclassified Nocardia]
MRQSKPVPADELTVALVIERLAREAAHGTDAAGNGRHRAVA